MKSVCYNFKVFTVEFLVVPSLCVVELVFILCGGAGVRRGRVSVDGCGNIAAVLVVVRQRQEAGASGQVDVLHVLHLRSTHGTQLGGNWGRKAFKIRLFKRGNRKTAPLSQTHRPRDFNVQLWSCCSEGNTNFTTKLNWTVILSKEVNVSFCLKVSEWFTHLLVGSRFPIWINRRAICLADIIPS